MNKVLFLHGALASKAQFDPLFDLIGEDLDMERINFSGHGGLEIPVEPFNFEMFMGDILSWMEHNSIGKTDIFGYSMGGYAGLYLARKHPSKVGRVFTLGTKLLWDKKSAEKEVQYLDPEKTEEKVPSFAKLLKSIHSPRNWKAIMKKTAEMMLTLGEEPPLSEEDFRKIYNEALLSIGDRDHTAGVKDTIEVYGWMHNARLMVIPNTPHPLDKAPLEALSREIVRFFSNSE